jgi:hypothetical protein
MKIRFHGRRPPDFYKMVYTQPSVLAGQMRLSKQDKGRQGIEGQRRGMARGRAWGETLGGSLKKTNDLPLAAALMEVDNLFQLGNAGFEAGDLRITSAR